MTAYRLADNHIFDYGEDIYVYHVNKIIGYRISPMLAKAIAELNRREDINAAELEPELKLALEKLDLLRDASLPKMGKIKTPDRKPVATISLNIAQLCNLSCIYCYGVDGEYGEKGFLKKKTAIDAVDWLFEQSLDHQHLSIQFFGGEPLLNFPRIKEVVAYADKKALETGKNMRYTMTTNGTMFTDEINAFLNEHKFGVMVSFDGNKEMQNKNRPFKGGKGSYDVAEKRIKTFLKSRNAENTTARATITGNNTDLEEVRRSLVGLGFNSASAIQVTMPNSSVFPEEEKKKLQRNEESDAPRSCATSSGCGSQSQPADKKSFAVKLDTTGLKLKQAKILNQADSQINKTEFQRIMEDLDFRARDTLDRIKKRKLIADRSILSLTHRLHSRKPQFYFCGGGRGYMSISISGDIYPCHRMVGQKDKKIGNIYDWNPESQKPFIENYGMSHPKCSGCFARYHCGGGCFQESIEVNGSMSEPNDEYCRQMRRSLELAIVVYDKLDIFDKAYLGMIKPRKKQPVNGETKTASRSEGNMAGAAATAQA